MWLFKSFKCCKNLVQLIDFRPLLQWHGLYFSFSFFAWRNFGHCFRLFSAYIQLWPLIFKLVKSTENIFFLFQDKISPDAFQFIYKDQLNFSMVLWHSLFFLFLSLFLSRLLSIVNQIFHEISLLTNIQLDGICVYRV